MEAVSDGGTSDPHVLISSDDFELAQRRRPISLVDLEGVPLLFLHRQPGVEALLRLHTVQPHIAFRTDDNQTLIALVAEGLGAAIVPRLAVAPFDQRLVEIEVEEALPVREIALAWSAERELSAPAQAFVEASMEPTRGEGSENPLDTREPR